MFDEHNVNEEMRQDQTTGEQFYLVDNNDNNNNRGVSDEVPSAGEKFSHAPLELVEIYS